MHNEQTIHNNQTSQKSQFSDLQEANEQLQAQADLGELTRELEQCKSELTSCQQEQLKWKEQSLRLSADLDNFRKRIAKEQIAWTDMAQAKVLGALLAIIDDFDRAFEEIEKQKDEKLAVWLTGFALIRQSLNRLLESFDVKEMTEYKTFNPEYHEALMHVESAEHASGEIVSVLQRGYLFKDLVLRPAKVSVAK